MIYFPVGYKVLAKGRIGSVFDNACFVVYQRGCEIKEEIIYGLDPKSVKDTIFLSEEYSFTPRMKNK